MAPMRVLVTGASGKTGALIVAELLKLGPDTVDARVTVRSAVAKQLMLDLGVPPDNVFTIDLSSSDPTSAAALRIALQGCEALVVCTSAVPQPQVLPTLLGAAGRWFRQLVSRNSDEPFVPVATWKGGQTPQQVDWQGQVLQFDAAKAAGVQHIVLISSAGGCDPRHFLNHIGSGAGGQRGNILNWKRAAEQHLIASGVAYTILHPNHLIDTTAPCKLIIGVDDSIQQPHWRQRLRMPRSLLAVFAVQCLLLRDQGAANRSVDCAGQAVGDAAQATTTTEQVKAMLHDMPDNCNYNINDRTQPDAVFVSS